MKQSKHINKLMFALFICTLLIINSSCSSLNYYSQAAKGQAGILLNRDSISSLLQQDDLDPAFKKKLLLVLSIREFAEQKLALPVGNAYQSYSETGQKYIVWNVFAANEFSVEPLQWCYPIIGCASYRGYFKEAAAINYSKKLQTEGYETYVGGVKAYSTLGWFNDPVLDTFLSLSDIDLAGLLFHEISHRIFYIKGDTSFNESFATAVENFAIEQWLRFSVDEKEQNTSRLLQNYKQKQKDHQVFVSMVRQAREALDEVFQENLSTLEKRKQKNVILSKLKRKIKLFAEAKPERNGYIKWSEAINTAKLIPVNTYHDWVHAFTVLLHKHLNQEGCDIYGTTIDNINCLNGLKHFYQAAKQLSKQNKKKRLNTLKKLDQEPL